MVKEQKSTQGYIHLLRMEGNVTWHELLTELGSYAEKAGLAGAGLTDALLERESRYPTGMNASVGVAIPHADPKYTNRAAMVIAALDKPVLFCPMGGGDGLIPVEAVFLPLMGNSGNHLDLLGAVASFIQESGTLEALRHEEVISLLSERFDPCFCLVK